MPLYRVTQTRTFQEWYICEAEDSDAATTPAAFTELASGSEMGVTSDLDSEDVEEITEAELAEALGGAA